jgi:hypothetical protein
MSRHNTIRATLAVTVTAFALGAAGAGAMPLDGPHAAAVKAHINEFDAGHASIAQEQAQTRAAAQDKAQLAARADRRSPDAKDAAILAQRHEANAHLASPVPQGAPKFSTAQATALHSTQPALAKDDGNDIPLFGIILGLAGAGLLGVAGAVAVSKTTRSRRARVVA